MQEKVLELRNATLAYNKDYCALNMVNAEFYKGERVAIVGSYGSGKTSLLRVFAGLEKLKSGECLINGRDVSKTDFSHDISLGLLSSDPIFFENKTVLDNLCWALKVRGVEKDQRVAASEKVLADCGISGLATQKAKQLSPVDRRILQIARLLLRPIDVLLCDELFERFDSEERKSISSVFSQLLSAPQGNKLVLFACSDLAPYKSYITKSYVMELGDLRLEENSSDAKL